MRIQLNGLNKENHNCRNEKKPFDLSLRQRSNEITTT